MHDRRIEGETFVFGNAGGLYIRAMTWWDHETQSIWSQPIGEAISGSLTGTKLDLLPARVTTWENWVNAHPQTFVMSNDLERLGSFRQNFNEDFVIGVVVEREAKAYYYTAVEKAGVVNDNLGEIPLLVWAGERDFRVYLREIDRRVLNFEIRAEKLIDLETGSIWDVKTGFAINGPFEGKVLKPLPSLSSYDWAWMDFYPGTEFYRGD